jgi:hypothetical protein
MGCVGWIVGSATALIVAGVFAGIPMLLSFLNAPGALAQIVGLTVGLTLCLAAMIVSLLWARARVALVGEE